MDNSLGLWHDPVWEKILALWKANPRANTYKDEDGKLYLAVYNARIDQTEFIEPRVEVPWPEDWLAKPLNPR